MTVGRLKQTLRALLLRQVARRLAATTRQTRREALWRLVRRLDDPQATVTRRLLRELFDIEVGRHTYGAFKVDASILRGSRIGAFCSIGPGVRLGGTEHPTSFVSTHPFLYLANRGFLAADDPRFAAEYNRGVVVGDDVWIGANAVIAGGVTIGRGAVVGATAVVTHDVAPYTIVAGVPARQIGERFPADVAARLAEIDWPSWPDARIRAELASFYDVDAFLAGAERN